MNNITVRERVENQIERFWNECLPHFHSADNFLMYLNGSNEPTYEYYSDSDDDLTENTDKNGSQFEYANRDDPLDWMMKHYREGILIQACRAGQGNRVTCEVSCRYVDGMSTVC